MKAVCPICNKNDSSTEKGVKPFCSERCKTIDLANWLSESYRVPLKQEELDLDELQLLTSELESQDFDTQDDGEQ